MQATASCGLGSQMDKKQVRHWKVSSTPAFISLLPHCWLKVTNYSMLPSPCLSCDKEVYPPNCEHELSLILEVNWVYSLTMLYINIGHYYYTPPLISQVPVSLNAPFSFSMFMSFLFVLLLTEFKHGYLSVHGYRTIHGSWWSHQQTLSSLNCFWKVFCSNNGNNAYGAQIKFGDVN